MKKKKKLKLYKLKQLIDYLPNQLIEYYNKHKNLQISNIIFAYKTFFEIRMLEKEMEDTSRIIDNVPVKLLNADLKRSIKIFMFNIIHSLKHLYEYYREGKAYASKQKKFDGFDKTLRLYRKNEIERLAMQAKERSEKKKLSSAERRLLIEGLIKYLPKERLVLSDKFDEFKAIEMRQKPLDELLKEMEELEAEEKETKPVTEKKKVDKKMLAINMLQAYVPYRIPYMVFLIKAGFSDEMLKQALETYSKVYPKEKVEPLECKSKRGYSFKHMPTYKEFIALVKNEKLREKQIDQSLMAVSEGFDLNQDYQDWQWIENLIENSGAENNTENDDEEAINYLGLRVDKRLMDLSYYVSTKLPPYKIVPLRILVETLSLISCQTNTARYLADIADIIEECIKKVNEANIKKELTAIHISILNELKNKKK